MIPFNKFNNNFSNNDVKDLTNITRKQFLLMNQLNQVKPDKMVTSE